MNVGGFGDEFFRVRSGLTFGFAASRSGECISISQAEKMGDPAVVRLEVHGSLYDWSQDLQSLSRPELKLIWGALSSYATSEYTSEQVKLLQRFYKALRRRDLWVVVPAGLSVLFADTRADGAVAFDRSLSAPLAPTLERRKSLVGV